MKRGMDGPIGLSRRRVLEIGAALGASSAMSGLLPSMAQAAGELNMWWWGEQQLPGLQGFVADSVKSYSAATVKTMLQDTSVVISQFQTAAAAHKAPDIQYLWNGIYHMESVWLGYLAPLSGLVKDDVLTASQPTLLSHYDGKIYRMSEVYAITRAASATPPAFASSSLTLAVFGLIAGYYMTYAVGLMLWRNRELRLQPAREPLATDS